MSINIFQGVFQALSWSGNVALAAIINIAQSQWLITINVYFSLYKTQIRYFWNKGSLEWISSKNISGSRILPYFDGIMFNMYL